ncbi:hypothetical protein ISCGN_025893 [Ixodes scapularis]
MERHFGRLPEGGIPSNRLGNGQKRAGLWAGRESPHGAALAHRWGTTATAEGPQRATPECNLGESYKRWFGHGLYARHIPRDNVARCRNEDSGAAEHFWRECNRFPFSFLQRVTRECKRIRCGSFYLERKHVDGQNAPEPNKNVARKPQTRQRIFQTRGRLASKEPQQFHEWTETTRNIPLFGDKSRNKNEDSGAKAPVA